ncbi:MAG: hypothetical protein QNJ38_18485 [Prochloraceae cyanobacterium]|nr:hypothetical protein [Prochloraceae cyanobacterium]
MVSLKKIGTAENTETVETELFIDGLEESPSDLAVQASEISDENEDPDQNNDNNNDKSFKPSEKETKTEYRTERTFFNSGWSKLGIVGLIWAFVIGFLFLCGLIMMGGGSLLLRRQPHQHTNQANHGANDPQLTELEKIQAENRLLNQQIEQLHAVEATRVQQIEIEQLKNNRPIESEIPAKAPIEATPQQLPPAPPPQTIVVKQPLPANNQPQVKVAPIELSAIVRKSGHRRASLNWDKPVKPVALNLTNSIEKKPEPLILEGQKPTTIKNQARVLTWGTKATAILETQIGWEGNLGAIANKNLAIRLKEHLLSPSGKVVIPRGTKIIASIVGAKATGEIQLVAKYFQLEPKNNSLTIVPIPIGAVLIQDGDLDGLLIAEGKRKNTLDRDALGAILSGTARMTEIMNRPSSESFSSWERGSSSTVINGQGNTGAAFIGGAAEELNRRLSQRNGEEIRRMERQPVVFLLKKNRVLEIYVNKNFQPFPKTEAEN